MKRPLTTITVTAAMLLTECSDNPIISNPDEKFTLDETQSFSGSSLAYLEVQNFVGSILVEVGQAGVIEVTSTRMADRESDLDDIIVNMTRDGDNVIIT